MCKLDGGGCMSEPVYCGSGGKKSSRDAARAAILPSSSPRFNALVMPLATSRKSRPIAVVIGSGGSSVVDSWEVDNAFITLHGGQPAAATSTILAKISCSISSAPHAAAALHVAYCMLLLGPPLCMVLYDYVTTCRGITCFLTCRVLIS